LVVAPTHVEGENVTSLIRAELKRSGKLSQEERLLVTHKPMQWTDAEKADAARYSPGDVIRFHRTARSGTKKFNAGEAVRVTARTPQNGITVEPVSGNGPARTLPMNKAKSFSVFQERVLPVATGDLIRITASSRTLDGKHRINNGAAYCVNGFTKEGHLKLSNGWVISRDAATITHGYTTTSHVSQGRSVDTVLVAQGWESLGASSAKQLYVSISRGKRAVRVYTNDQRILKEALRQHDNRPSAREVMGRSGHRLEQAAYALQRLRHYESLREAAQQPQHRKTPSGMRPLYAR